MVYEIDKGYKTKKNKLELSLSILSILVIVCFAIITANISFLDNVLAIPAENNEQIKVTAYNHNMGQVKETMIINLTAGVNIINFTDVALYIDPTSVKPRFVDDCCFIQEQNYEYDLAGIQKLLQKYKGKEITLILDNKGVSNNNSFTDDGFQFIDNLENNNADLNEISFNNMVNEKTNNLISTIGTNITGRLLSFESANVLERFIISVDDDIYVIPVQEVRVIAFPSSLYSVTVKPTLEWKVFNNKEAGQKQIEISYLTRGINWKADYVATVNNNDSFTEINGWITLNNNAGTSFNNATVKFVAGAVNVVEDESYFSSGYDTSPPMASRETAESAVTPSPSMTTNPFSEYHLYSLNFTTDIDNGQSKQIQLLNYPNVTVDKTYEYNIPGFVTYNIDETRSNVESVISLNNSREEGLGIPLPAGTVKMFKQDSQGEMQFIGEDNILHSPVDENVTLKMGNAFDITASTTVTESTTISEDIEMNSYNVTLRNHKNESVDIIVNVNDLYGNWIILENSIPFIKKDASTIQFLVTDINPNSNKSFIYTIQRLY